MLLLMVLCYYFPYRAVFGVEPLSAFAAAVLALTIAQAVFTADLVRAAVDGVSQQVILGARALGLHHTTVWRYIILPDIIRQISPALLAFYIGNLKLSSLASAIGCEELLFTARTAGDRTARNLEGLIIVTGIYILFVLPLAWGARRLEQPRWLKRRS